MYSLLKNDRGKGLMGDGTTATPNNYYWRHDWLFS